MTSRERAILKDLATEIRHDQQLEEHAPIPIDRLQVWLSAALVAELGRAAMQLVQIGVRLEGIEAELARLRDVAENGAGE